jgi:ABC-2 type transport system permease protein
MRELWIVVGREFGERIRSRAFLISTLLVPLFLGALLLLPFLVERDTVAGHYRLAVIDGTGTGIGEDIGALLEGMPASAREPSFEVRHAPPTPTAIDSLTEAVRAGRLEGVLVLPQELLDERTAVYRARNVTNFAVLDAVDRATRETVRAARLDRAGLDAGRVAELLQPVTVQTSRVTRHGEGGGDAQSTLYFAYLIAFLLFMLILMYGAQVMQSVHEEKTNRISELLVSSVRSWQLLAGKIAGVAGVAMVQVAIWLALAGVLLAQRSRVEAGLGGSGEMLGAFMVGPGQVALLLLYAALGFFLYAALYAAAGAATNDSQESQQFAFVVMAPLIVPLVLQFSIIAEPHGAVARAVSWIPLTSPVAMPIRLGATDVPPAEIAGSLAVLGLGLVVVAWAAGKIYRIGILSTGRRPGLAELGRWLRASDV